MARNNNIVYSIFVCKKRNKKCPYKTCADPITARTQRLTVRNHLKSILPVLKQWLETHPDIEAVVTFNSNERYSENNYIHKYHHHYHGISIYSC